MRNRGSGLLRWSATLCALSVLVGATPLHGFELSDVAAKAEQLAAVPFDNRAPKVPPSMLELTYDQWRDIRFRPDQALWHDEKLPFQLQFFHPGLYYDRTVAVHVIDGGIVKPVEFSTRLFDYGKNRLAGKVPADLGFAGFRIHYPLNRPDYHDEAIVFLGASYFRSLAKDQVYGLSARGLAIDTIASTREEFPAFREYWLERPQAQATSIVVYALLDGPSVTGAYRFLIEPGEQTVVHVQAKIFLRRGVEKLGLAPLTSMFFHGENTLQPFVDYRPEVHDSDGLLVHSGSGEWLWRPLQNPQAILVNTFAADHPKGFGLLQRDRAFEHHMDLETRTDLRPSVWIATDSDWGRGHVELVQLPTNTDINDNIVAYWVPSTPPKPGEALAFGYTMYWYGDDPTRPPGGRVVSTRRDYGTQENVHRFVLDFEGEGVTYLPIESAPRGVVSIAGGKVAAEVIEQHVVKNPVTGGWRLSFQVRPNQTQTIELRAFLERRGRALTETWSYAIVP